MDMSPPKRMTRARAAAKASEITSTTTHTSRATRTTASAAAKAKATRSVSTTTPATVTRTAIKRKLRSDDNDDEDELCHAPEDQHGPAKSAATSRRGRPKKIASAPPETEVQPEPEKIAGRATRMRKRVTIEEPPKEEPAKAVRTRGQKAGKTTEDEEPEEPVDDAIKTKATRTRGAAAATKASAARAATRKTVKFEEPEKENIEARTRTRAKAAEPPATGMRAKPVRRVAAARSTRATSSKAGSAKATAEKTPLSPKKVTQMPVNKDPAASDDELAKPEKTPLKKAPIRPPVSAHKDDKENETVTRGTTTTSSEDPFVSNEPKATAPSMLHGSPARRMPQSPFKDIIKSPPKRFELSAPQSTIKNEGTMSSSKISLLQSPAKRPLFPIKRNDSEEITTLHSPFKTSLLQSPAKRGSVLKTLARQEPVDPTATPAPKPPVLGTPLRPITSINNAVIGHEAIPEEVVEEVFGATPSKLEFPGRLSAIMPRFADPAMNGELEAAKEIAEARGEQGSPTPVTLKIAGSEVMEAGVELVPAEEFLEVDAEIDFIATEAGADDETTQSQVEETTAQVETICQAEDPMVVDELQKCAAEFVGSAFKLRQIDLDAYDHMDSEDELADTTRQLPDYQDDDEVMADAEPVTPTPTNTINGKTSKYATNSFSLQANQRLGFTPLASQLSAWRSSSPQRPINYAGTKAGAVSENEEEHIEQSTIVEIVPAPARGTFFEDELAARPEQADDPDATESESEADADDDFEEMEIQQAVEKAVEEEAKTTFDPFGDVHITEEDVALASEANEMSLLEPEDVGMVDDQPHPGSSQDDNVSEASQEYGDENAMPIDPALMDSTVHVPPVTPARYTTKTFHTVSKVPLKPADDSTPRLSYKQRRQSAVPRFPSQSQRARGPMRNATAISYSPDKESTRSSPNKKGLNVNITEPSAPSTPVRKTSGTWSTAGTPARTPRADINPVLLKGAIVFVDVHTSEGADASGIFVELLTQMGAKCVKTWNWNPNATSPTTEAAPTLGQTREQKIGITHVVYKDGSKRTLEKVRESNSVVQCVGVSWVLDCERENKWLDETAYLIDTSLVPRGGAGRRKTMEPRALANMDGTLVSRKSFPGLPSLREAQSAPSTPAKNNGRRRSSRRESTVWIRTPEKPAEGDKEHNSDDENDEWNTSGFLTPLPKTPAPEQIRRFVDNVTPTDWSSGDELGDENVYEDENSPVPIGSKTAPAKDRFKVPGAGILGKEKDEGILMRLMAARRKSLQFAPKIGSPLARTWD